MGVLSTIDGLRSRPLQGLITAADVVLRPSDVLDDLGRVGAGARPVVIQGGLSTDAYLYEPLADILRARGFDDVSATGLDFHGFASFQRDARNLAGVVEAAADRSRAAGGDGKVTVLAHSKGGQTARWYLQRLGGLEHVDQFVTMGTPHNGAAPLGTRIAALSAYLPASPPGLRQLSPQGAEIRALNADLPEFMAQARGAHPDFRIVSVAGDVDLPFLRGTDGLVANAESRLDDRVAGLHNLVFQGRGAHHGAIVAQYGVHEPSVRAAAVLAARGSVDDAAGGTALLAR